MKLSITLLLSLLVGLSASAQTIEERVEELEIARTLNIFKFSGDLTLFYDGIELENGTSSEVDDTTYSTRLWAGINFNANPYDDVKFYGRLAVSKFFNEAFGSEERVADTSASRSQATLPHANLPLHKCQRKVTFDLLSYQRKNIIKV